jgi:predicted metal-dependent hydrolase
MNDSVNHPILGLVEVRHSLKARHYRLAILPGGKVVLTIPRGGNIARGIRFAADKQEWIEKVRARSPQQPDPWAEFPGTRIFGNISIEFRPSPGKRFRTEQTAPLHYTLYFPEVLLRGKELNGAATYDGIKTDLTNPPDKGMILSKALRPALVRIFRAEALRQLPDRLAALALINGLPCRSVSVREMSGRWGSCSNRNDIRLNLHLVRLPLHLAEFVILHELAHIRVKNHGPEFHNYLDRLSQGKTKALRTDLRAYHPCRF